MIDIDRLRQLAQATNEHSDDRVKILAEFYAATESDTIIELLDRIEAAEKARDDEKWLRTGLENYSKWVESQREELRTALALAQSRIERLEYDMKSGDYETLYAQAAAELDKLHAKGEEK